MLGTGAAKMRETLDTTAPKYFRRAIEERLAEENFPQNIFQNL